MTAWWVRAVGALLGRRGFVVLHQDDVSELASISRRKVDRRIRKGYFDVEVRDRAERLGWQPRLRGRT